MNEITNINDRKILVLLSCKERKTCGDKRRIHLLESMYPDHETFKERLIQELLQVGYLSRTVTHGRQGIDENGDPIEAQFSQPTITDSGFLALRRGVFASESAQNAREKRNRRLDVFYKVAAIVGGLLGIANLLWMFFTQIEC